MYEIYFIAFITMGTKNNLVLILFPDEYCIENIRYICILLNNILQVTLEFRLDGKLISNVYF